MTRMAIIYYSSGGTIDAIADAVRSGGLDLGCEVRMCRLAEPGARGDGSDPLADLEWADGLVLGTPACFGNVAAPVKQLIDSTIPLWRQGKLADKVISGFTAAASLHGGHETTLLALYQSVYHWGSLIVPMGYTDPSLRAAGGNPYGVSANAHQDGAVDAAATEAARYLGRRVACFAVRLNSPVTAAAAVR
jgi:NAD(P)H dehydrogenase (quinone)